MPSISLATAIGFGLRKFSTIVVHGNCVRLAACYGKGIDAIKMVPTSSITTDIVAIHVDRIASHKFGYDDYLCITPWLWCGWIVRLFIDIDINVIAPAITVILKYIPACCIAIKPHLIPARILNIRRIICN